MKKKFFPVGLFFLFLCCLAAPDTVFAGASAGLELWFQTVLPTLFPFLLLTSLLTGANAFWFAAGPADVVFGRLFCISPAASFAVLSGLLCGCPMGAKCIGDLLAKGYLSKREGEYLLSFCNTISPAFIVSFVFKKSLHMTELLFPSLVILYASPVLVSLFSRRYYCMKFPEYQVSFEELKQTAPFSVLLDDSLTKGCETITKIGGYMILFSVLSRFALLLPMKVFPGSLLLTTSMEVTSGVTLLCQNISSEAIRYVLVMGLVSFGGVCAIFQTQCMVWKYGFSMGRYTIEKLITALVTSLLSFLYIILFR